MATRRASYGVDAPTVPIAFAVGAIVSGALVILGLFTDGSTGSIVGWTIAFVLFVAFLGIYMHSTRRGKFLVWEDLLDEVAVAPDARVLDLGCGRGAVLLAVAGRLGAEGHAEGIDLWRSIDQSGNSMEVAMANAEAEGVAGTVELHTGDLRNLPFEDNSFDLVVSSLAIHNIKSKTERDDAAIEALRVVRPGGQVVMVDLPAGKGYLTLLDQKLTASRLRGAGWRMWWGGPFYASTVLTGSKAN